MVFATLLYADTNNSFQFYLDETGNTITHSDFSHLPAFNFNDIQNRFLTLECLVEPRLTSEVEAYLRSYLTYGYRDTERIIGRSSLYFPIIEHYLQTMNLPDELKYLPVIESSLRPYATSTVGAAGLWQFMRGTAYDNGLTVNSTLDERRDPYKSTKAALELLSNLYNKYGTWEMALAAYNCGPGNVNKAIRRAGGVKNFWTIRKYLPRETQRYVPRFIAATYTIKNYYHHGISPKWPDFDRQWTRTTKVYDAITFSKLIKNTGVSLSVLKELNPSYQKGYLPNNPSGNFLILPESAMLSFQTTTANANANANAKQYEHGKYYKRNYTVLIGDTLEKLANMYNCSVHQIMKWNNLKDENLYYRQELILYHKKGNKWNLPRA